jgi:hypothetical protein
MKITEVIDYLEDCLRIYGDCDVLKLNNLGLDSIDEVIFIGGNRLLLKSNNEYENMTFDLYNGYEKLKNVERKKEWLKDCENCE